MFKNKEYGIIIEWRRHNTPLFYYNDKYCRKEILGLGIDMKKMIVVVLLLFQMTILMSCREKAGEKENTLPQVELSETATPSVAARETAVTSDISNEDVKKENVLEYFPDRENKQYFYEGKGNEYAAFWSYADYQDRDSGRIQLRTDNGGTQTVQVMEGNSTSLSVIVSKEECYYRDNLLNYNSVEEPEILLKAPLEKGTEWTLADGRKRYISDVEKNIKTPSGDYKTIEVTTEEKEGQTRDYYAKGVGLVKREYSTDGLTVTSLLKKIKETPLVQSFTLYYPNEDEKLLEEVKDLKFNTNDITRFKVQELLREKHGGNQGLISVGTNLNSLYKGSDGIVYADFSKELINEMNAGAGFEQLILQGVADSLGRYYDAKEVYLTVEQKPYESGHILLKKGETLKVSK